MLRLFEFAITCLLFTIVKSAGERLLLLDDNVQDLLDWLEAENGIFNPKAELRRLDPYDSSSRFGMFAKEDIEAGSVLLRIPTNVVMNSKKWSKISDEGNNATDNNGKEQEHDKPVEMEKEEDFDIFCNNVRYVAQHLKLGNESEYSPYIRYLLNTTAQNPSTWSDAGKALFENFLSGEGILEGGGFILPPDTPAEWLTIDWMKRCNGSSDDQIELFSVILVAQRAWDHLMIPFYDMINHHNGEKYMNTMCSEMRDQVPIVVKAKRDIKAGEEIYSTYNLCEDCGVRYTTYGTPEIFRDYGFIEQYPQSWIFHPLELGFRVDHVPDSDDDDIEVIEWIDGLDVEDEEDVEKLELLLTLVKERSQSFLNDNADSIPDNEWSSLVEYADAMEKALEAAVSDAKMMDFVGDDVEEYEENRKYCKMCKIL